MEQFERKLMLAAIAYVLAVLVLMAYLLLKSNNDCSPDGYVLVGGLPAYDSSGLPLRCKRLPLP